MPVAAPIPIAWLVLTALLCTAPAAAQTPRPPAAKSSAAKPAALPTQPPYAPVAVTIRGAPDDPGLAAFRNEVMTVARARVFASFARLLVPRGFFWDRDFVGGFDPKKSGPENFAAAIKLDQRQGAGWNALIALAAEAVGGAVPSRPGVVCAPAKPDFDEIEFDRLTASTRSEPSDWRYPRTAGAELRAGPRPNAPVIDKFGLYLVRVLADETPDAWTRVAAPSGKIGFVAPFSLLPLQGERLCYAKDVTGRWHIAGYIGGGD